MEKAEYNVYKFDHGRRWGGGVSKLTSCNGLSRVRHSLTYRSSKLRICRKKSNHGDGLRAAQPSIPYGSVNE